MILTAMRKEPQRRYASAEEFAEDVRRHLQGRPVKARRDTLAYRTAKFVSRNRPFVAAGLVVVLSLIIGIAAIVLVNL